MQVLVFQETPRSVLPSYWRRRIITLWMSPNLIPEKAISRNVPSSKISAVVDALWRMRRSHWISTISGRGRLSLRSVANFVLQKLETTGEKQSLKHVRVNCFHDHLMAFSVILLNLPASDAPAIRRSASRMSSRSERSILRFRQIPANAIRQLRYRKIVFGEKPSSIRMR